MDVWIHGCSRSPQTSAHLFCRLLKRTIWCKHLYCSLCIIRRITGFCLFFSFVTRTFYNMYLASTARCSALLSVLSPKSNVTSYRFAQRRRWPPAKPKVSNSAARKASVPRCPIFYSTPIRSVTCSHKVTPTGLSTPNSTYLNPPSTNT